MTGCEFCGHEFPEELGRYGCPNCEGNGLEKESQAMPAFGHKDKTRAALDLVRQGLTAYEAAKRSGITSGTLYKSAEYRAILAARATDCKYCDGQGEVQSQGRAPDIDPPIIKCRECGGSGKK